MSLFFIDQREFLREVHEAINQGGEGLTGNLEALIGIHGIQIKKDVFIPSVIKLCAANNAKRAHKLVDAIGDSSLRLEWIRVIFMIALLIRFALFVGAVWIAIWLYLWMAE